MARGYKSTTKTNVQFLI